MSLDLREEWEDLLRRRPAFRASLAFYGAILERWAAQPAGRRKALRWSAQECRQRWDRGVPLLAEARLAPEPEEMEEVLGAVMEDLAAVDPARAPAVQRFAQAWDRGDITPAALFPARGRIGSASVEQASGLSATVVAFLACAGLRPVLEPFFASCRAHATEAWTLGVCPFCGAPPGFTDVIEDGRRRLACHLCSGQWIFAKLRCPLCGVDAAQEVVRLQPEDAREEGYLVTACRQCRGYLKELDRRVRWNGQSALVEDWGSPHYDLIARRQGYWRPVPSLLDLLPA